MALRHAVAEHHAAVELADLVLRHAGDTLRAVRVVLQGARAQRRPVPWVQPTFIAHDEAARQCGQALAEVVKTGWPREGDAIVWVGTLPAGLQGGARALELWLPTPAQDRRAANLRDTQTRTASAQPSPASDRALGVLR